MTLAFTGMLLLAAAALQGVDTPFSTYIGSDACIECHTAGATAAECCYDEIAGHANTFDALEKSTARSIAALTGTVEPPQESRLCLGCHATAADLGPRWWQPSFSLAAGVQCEACHGAGSAHAAARRDEAAKPPVSADVHAGDLAECHSCHRARPSHEAVLTQGYRLPEADRRYKTPVNIALAPDGRLLYVTCEHSDSLVVVDVESSAVVCEVAVGRRPHGVAIAPDGATVYVSNRFSRSLSVIDTSTLRVLREIPVGDDPHGICTSPSGDRVYVSNTGEDSISVVDVARGIETKRLAAGSGPWAIAAGPDGRSVVATSVRPLASGFREAHRSELTVVSTREDIVVARDMAQDANMLHGLAPISGRGALLFTLMRTKNLVPITRLAQGWVMTSGVGVLWADGRVDQVVLDEPANAFPDPSGIAVSPDGRRAAVTSAGGDEILLLDVERLLDTITTASDKDRAEILPNHLGMSDRFVLGRIRCGANPRALVFSRDSRWMYVAESLDDSIAVVDVDRREIVRHISLGGPREITEIRAGERLFHNAGHTQGHQFACASCHPDGHVDGLSFDIEADGLGLHPVDNRSLRGIFDTPPFKWEGTNPTLQRQCGPRFAVFFTRLEPFKPDELAALVRYISTIERPTNPHHDPRGMTLAERRGKAVFERETTNFGRAIPRERRCTTCHDSAYHSAAVTRNVGTTMWFDALRDAESLDLGDDNPFGPLGTAYFQDYASLDRAFDAPHLTNVYADAPYLHNGAASSLHEVWTRFNLYEQHGITHDLTRRQINDLVAYLKTL
jgi:YVTN family beta-propeller protein